MYFCKRVRELFVILLVIESSLCDVNEPRCYSRFDYDEKMMEKLVRTEIKMEELLGKLEDLEKRHNNIATEVDNSVKEIHDLGKKHGDLKTELDNSVKEIHDLGKKHDDLKIELDNSKAAVETFENMTKSDIDGLEKSIEMNDQRLDAMYTNITESKLQASVAFFTRPLSHITTSSGQTLVFDFVTTDVGGGYSPGTGVFTAPADGLYVFSITVMVQMSSSGSSANFSLKKNDIPVMWLYANDKDSVYETPSGTGLLSLQVGDTVHVTCETSGRFIHGSFTFFSGFKL
ncbi:HIP-like protein [Mya arenaria]|uniref:HIP-like protein n=1 Tax=Mya arenaria TaxID=6604 RepID=A0ABY7GEC3_MYAAR|nr:uncharacterized protein LOC128222944 [Mya arenaria]WAR31583.1 HIP-like protein [Mya arenaria]